MERRRDEVEELRALARNHQDYFATLVDRHKQDLSQIVHEDKLSVPDDTSVSNEVDCDERARRSHVPDEYIQEVADDPTGSDRLEKLIEKERHTWIEKSEWDYHGSKPIQDDLADFLKSRMSIDSSEDALPLEREFHELKLEFTSVKNRNRQLEETLASVRQSEAEAAAQVSTLTTKLEQSAETHRRIHHERELSEKHLSAALRKAERENFRLQAELEKEQDAGKNISNECDRLKAALVESSSETEILLRREKASWEMEERTRVQGLLAELEREKHARTKLEYQLRQVSENAENVPVYNQQETSEGDSRLLEANKALEKKVFELESRVQGYLGVEEFAKRQQRDNDKLLELSARQSEDITRLREHNESLNREIGNLKSSTSSSTPPSDIRHEELTKIREENTRLREDIEGALQQQGAERLAMLKELDAVKTALASVDGQYVSVHSDIQQQSSVQQQIQQRVAKLDDILHQVLDEISCLSNKKEDEQPLPESATPTPTPAPVVRNLSPDAFEAQVFRAVSLGVDIPPHLVPALGNKNNRTSPVRRRQTSAEKLSPPKQPRSRVRKASMAKKKSLKQNFATALKKGPRSKPSTPRQKVETKGLVRGDVDN